MAYGYEAQAADVSKFAANTGTMSVPCMTLFAIVAVSLSSNKRLYASSSPTHKSSLLRQSMLGTNPETLSYFGTAGMSATQDQSSPSKPHHCDHPGCAQRFRYGSELRKHEVYHRPRELICDQCQKKFHLPKDLRRHQETHNETRKRFFCEVEGCKGRLVGFAREETLQKHVERIHSGFMDPQSAAHEQSSSIDPEADDEETTVDDPQLSDTMALAFPQPQTSDAIMLGDRQQENIGRFRPDPTQSDTNAFAPPQPQMPGMDVFEDGQLWNIGRFRPDPTQSDTTALASPQPQTSVNNMFGDLQPGNMGRFIPDPRQPPRRRDDSNFSPNEADDKTAAAETHSSSRKGKSKRRKKDTAATETGGDVA